MKVSLFSLTSAFLCFFLFAPTVRTADLNKEFIISYVEHESIINYYVPLLDAAYKAIGITPVFVLINDKRALMLLNKGEIDADTAKTTEMLGAYPDIIRIPTPISKIEVFLVCQLHKKCDLSVLKDSRNILGVIGAMEFYSNLLTDANIKIVELSSFAVLLEMFKQKKLDYVLMVFDDHSRATKDTFDNKYLIEEKIGYHLINKRHEDLVPALEKSIASVIKKGLFSN